MSLAELLDQVLLELVACLIPKVSGHLWCLEGRGDQPSMAGGVQPCGWSCLSGLALLLLIFSCLVSENLGQMGLQGRKQKNIQKNDLFMKIK